MEEEALFGARELCFSTFANYARRTAAAHAIGSATSRRWASAAQWTLASVTLRWVSLWVIVLCIVYVLVSLIVVGQRGNERALGVPKQVCVAAPAAAVLFTATVVAAISMRVHMPKVKMSVTFVWTKRYEGKQTILLVYLIEGSWTKSRPFSCMWVQQSALVHAFQSYTIS